MRWPFMLKSTHDKRVAAYVVRLEAATAAITGIKVAERADA